MRKTEPMKEFFESLRRDMLAGRSRHPLIILKQARDLKITPFDVLEGIMQPLFCELEKLQDQGQANVIHMHAFSKFMNGIFSEISRSRINSRKLMTNTKAPKVLLTCADGNYHVFGPRLVKEYLFKEGISSICHFPSLPFHEIIAAAEGASIGIIGISVATEEQTKNTLMKWKDYYKTLRGTYAPNLILGGFGVPHDVELPAHTFVHEGSFEELSHLIEKVLRDKAA